MRDNQRAATAVHSRALIRAQRCCPSLSLALTPPLFISPSLPPSLSLSESGLQSMSSSQSAAAAAAAVLCEQSRRGRGGRSSPARAVRLERDKTCRLTLSIPPPPSPPLTLTVPSLFRAASGETTRLLPCYSGTDDKAGLLTRRRDPGHGAHTYGRQE